MMSALHLATTAGYAALMAWAAVADCRRLVIPNRLIVALLLLWPIHLVGTRIGLSTGLAAAGGALAVFLGGALLHTRGLFGGGDVKLLAAAALWAGGGRLLPLLLAIGLGGGALSLLVLTPLGRWIGNGRCGAAGRREAATPDTNSVLVPYGAAIAGAALLVTLPAVWG
jgi:prepilin peptidase CpaA